MKTEYVTGFEALIRQALFLGCSMIPLLDFWFSLSQKKPVSSCRLATGSPASRLRGSRHFWLIDAGR